MAQVATVSSKGQVLIPAQIRKQLKMNGRTRVSIHVVDGEIRMKPDPFAELLALRGSLAKHGADLEAFYWEEKRKERAREDVKMARLL